jgi:hypothetical protein
MSRSQQCLGPDVLGQGLGVFAGDLAISIPPAGIMSSRMFFNFLAIYSGRVCFKNCNRIVNVMHLHCQCKRNDHEICWLQLLL